MSIQETSSVKNLKRILKGTATIVKQGDKRIIIIPKQYHDKIKDYEGNQILFEIFDFDDEE